jgi:DNA-binding transcriptional ArsR family regulator
MSPRSRKGAPASRRPAKASAIAASREAVAGVFAALGDPTRLKLVAVLCAGGAFSIAQLTAGTDISRQGVTKHLQVLADAGVVSDARQGRERLWQLEPVRIDEAKQALDAIGRQWEAALGRLKAFVERD